ncbi:MAG: type II toxin-antitoxin system RelE/ParE family toxin [Spirochaetota bacterium]
MYSIIISSAANRDYKRLPQSEILKINKVIDHLASNPRPSGYKKLKDRNAYRIRIGNYRIIYEINDKDVILFVIRIRHRKEVYKNL